MCDHIALKEVCRRHGWFVRSVYRYFQRGCRKNVHATFPKGIIWDVINNSLWIPESGFPYMGRLVNFEKLQRRLKKICPSSMQYFKRCKQEKMTKNF